VPVEPVHRVLLVEDDAPTRAHLARAIEVNPRLSLVGAAASCGEARAMLAVEIPDVLVTDLGLEDGSGNSLIREVTRAEPKALAMVITVFGDERSLVESIEAGATGYLLKSTPFSEIAPAILELLRGGSPISAPIARYLLRRFSRPASPAKGEVAEVAAAADVAPPLSGREAEVLQLVAKGFQFSEIAELLGISSHTVTTHIRHIYRKLDVHSRGAAVHEAMSRGIIDL
jgi:DNA-binding NarL/FixJ family response regulator